MNSNHLILKLHGDIGVIDTLLERKKNREQEKQHDADGRTVGILLNGGGQRGVLLGGITLALEKAGITNLFDHVAGVSIGAVCAWYFCAGEVSKGGPAYYNGSVEDDYIRESRPWRMLDLSIADRIIRKEKPIQINRLRAFPGKIHIGLTDAKSGDGVFVDPRTFKDPLAPIITSCAIPFLDGKLFVELEGKEYVDGGIAWPLPARYCVETLHCTDLLVLMTHPLQPARETLIDTIGDIFVPFFYPRPFARSFRNRLQRYNEEIKYLTDLPHRGVRICTLYPEHALLSMFSKNKKELKKTECASEEFMKNLLASRTSS